MVRATISADIVSSTSLSVEELTLLQSKIRRFLDELSEKSQGKNWGRLFKGDSVEIFLHDPHEALRVALLLKTLVKKTFSWGKETNVRRELFRKYGIRLAIGIGEMRIANQKQDVLDGDAIYYSGRLLEKQKQSGNDRLLINSSMCFGYKDNAVDEYVSVVLDFWGYWWAALMITVMHFVIDGLKSVCKNLKGAFFIDQLLHLAVIVATVIIYNNVCEIALPAWLPETKVLLWIVAFVFCLRPANFFIQNIFKEAKITVPANGEENQSLPNAGHVIGDVERMLTLVFVMLGQYEAIGFLLAAKSLLRFRETDTVKSEYVLVGTLLSFGIAILVGVIVKYSFNSCNS